MRLGQRRIDCQHLVQRGNGVVELSRLQHGDTLLETLVRTARLLVAEEFMRRPGGNRLGHNGLRAFPRQVDAQQSTSQHRDAERKRNYRASLVVTAPHMTPLCGATLRNGTPRKVRIARPKIATTADQP